MIVLAAGALLQTAIATLSLNQAVEYARAHRGTVAVAAAVAREARGLHRVAGQLPNPGLFYSRTQDTPRQHVAFDQPLSWLLTRGVDRAVTEAGIRRAEVDSTALLSGVAQDVRRAFFGAIAAREAHRLAEGLQVVSDSLRRIARARFAAGDIARLELEQAEQDARRQAQALSMAREAEARAMAAFAQAIGAGPPAPAPEGPLDADLDHPLGDPLGLPLLVQAAEADSAAADAGRRSARRAAIPFPGLEVGADWDDPALPGRTLSVVGLSLPLPLWHRNGGERAVADARAEQASAALVEARLAAERQVTELRSRLLETALRARFARDSLVPAARVLRDRALAAYRVGETGVVPVLEALRSEREVAMAAVEDLVRFQDARADWLELFGRLQ
jgi:cobalt-zinc-cadmium efflux system outer membrane protein